MRATLVSLGAATVLAAVVAWAPLPGASASEHQGVGGIGVYRLRAPASAAAGPGRDARAAEAQTRTADPGRADRRRAAPDRLRRAGWPHDPRRALGHGGQVAGDRHRPARHHPQRRAPIAGAGPLRPASRAADADAGLERKRASAVRADARGRSRTDGPRTRTSFRPVGAPRAEGRRRALLVGSARLGAARFYRAETRRAAAAVDLRRRDGRRPGRGSRPGSAAAPCPARGPRPGCR
jgi:hypothetical protein